MGRQKKRTMKKYNRSRRKNNTRRKTHKKRVRKTHKKRTHKRMKGGSREGLITGETKSQPTIERAAAMGQTIMDKTRTGVQSVKDKFSTTSSPTNLGYEKQTDSPSPEPIQLPAEKLSSPQLPAAQPPTVTSQQEQVVAPSSNPSKNKEILKHVASGLGGAAIYSNPMAALGTAAGVAGAVGAYKLGQIGYRGIGSAKDKLKSKALMKNIEQCLKILVNYAVIGDSGKEAILQKLKKNSGYFDEQGNAPKITFKKKLRNKQIDAKNAAVKANEDKKIEGQYALNVGETPEVVANTTPQQLPGSPALSTDVTSGVGAQGLNHHDSDFTPGFGPSLNTNTTSI